MLAKIKPCRASIGGGGGISQMARVVGKTKSPHLCCVPTVFRTWYQPGGRRYLGVLQASPSGGACSPAPLTAPVALMRLKLPPGITDSVGTFLCTPRGRATSSPSLAGQLLVEERGQLPQPCAHVLLLPFPVLP